MQRLDKILVNLGKGSRSEIKALAKASKIYVNGQKCLKTDIKLDPLVDEIVFCGEKVNFVENIYIMLNKKAGYVSATEDNLSETVMDLLPLEYRKMKLFPVGRLDKDTEGLILITNDGKLSHALMSPKHDVNKIYYAEVSGEILSGHTKIFADGIVFRDDTKCKPAKLEILESSTISKALVTISEGKFHQVKNMFRVIDCTVTYLKRIKIADLELDENLKLGESRLITDAELEGLKYYAYGK